MSLAMQSAQHLCDHCMGIPFDSSSGDAVAYTSTGLTWEITDTFPDLPNLSSSAASGCTFCNYIIYVIRHVLPSLSAQVCANPGSWVKVELDNPAYAMRSDITEFGPSWEDDEYTQEPDGPYWLSLVFTGEDWDKKLRTRAWVYQGSKAVAESLNIALRKPAQHVLDAQCVSLIQSWLSNCEVEHSSCSSWILSSFDGTLPTRLIDIGDASDLVARLICTEQAKLPPSTEYVALSYCWGKPSLAKPQLVTTTSNISQHQAGMLTSSMPQAFQDLIVLVHRLKTARYVWIDALCIIQDDLSDWEREASRMTTVYRNAWLTVVAAAGDSCHSGFLARKPAPPHAIVPVRLDRHSQEDDHYILYPLNEHRYWDADLPSQLHGSAWSQRAWTFQEDLMSTRVLYFGTETAYFRCQTERRLENSCITRPPQVSWHTLLARSEGDSDRSELTKESECSHGNVVKRQTRDILYEKWRLLVTEYTERQLTVASDKLPALSGLARTFSLALGRDKYLAGLWRGNLIWDLLWVVYHDAVRSRGRAPSWSWVAWEGTIGHSRKFDKELLQPQCVVKEAQAPAVGRNPFGTVDATASWIILSECKLIKVELRPTDRELDDLMLYPAELFITRGNDSIVVGYGMIDGISTSGLKKNGTYRPADMDSIPRNDETLALLLVRKGEILDEIVGTEESEAEVYYQGLLVTSCAPSVDPRGLRTFERIGMFQSDMRDTINLWDSCAENELKLI
ncbi:HET-domain-containing protein [Xylaria sp. FL1042]|nr:HET-domain-containing protein [Xylaria sp. FL1042]